MDLCNGDPTGEEPKNPKPKRAQSRKRHQSPEPTESRTKRRRTDHPQPQKAPKSKRKQRTDIPSPSTSPEANPAPERTADHCHSRKRHNLVEQKYRWRLNSQFKQLLDVLPNSDTHDGNPSARTGSPLSPPGAAGTGLTGPREFPSAADRAQQSFNHAPPQAQAHVTNNTWDNNRKEDDKDRGEAGDQRRVSKGEVLDRARMYIQSLEREHLRLVAERRELDFVWEEGYRRRCGIGGT